MCYIFSILFLGSEALRQLPKLEPQSGQNGNASMHVEAALIDDFLIHRDMITLELLSRSPERVSALKSDATQSHNGLPKSRSIFAFTHHKSGTFLAKSIIQHAAQLTQSHWFGAYKGTQQCHPDQTGIYMNLNVATIANLNAQCHDFRAFHLIRESVALTASGYLYHRWSIDTIPGTGPEILKKAKSLQDALSIEAEAQVHNTLPEMVACHEMLKDDPRVLTVRMEDFHFNFDKTVRSIFMHLYGSDFKDLDKLVSAASAEDVSRWPPNKLAENKHVASDSDRSEVLNTLKSLLFQKVPTMLALPVFDEKMSYAAPSN